MAEQTAPRPDVPSSIPPHQQAGYDAVHEVIRATPGDAWRNALIWRAVKAYQAASEQLIEHRDAHPYVHLTYGPWEASGHQCGDIQPGGCDEPVDERKVTAQVNVPGEERLVGWELRDCQACAPRPDVPDETTFRTEARGLDRVHLIALIADAVALRREGVTSTGATWADWDRAAARILDRERS